VTRSLTFIGALAVAVVLSAVKANAHPVGAVFAPVYRPAPVYVPPPAGRSGRETIKFPTLDVHTTSFPEAKYPALGSWHREGLRPGLQWYPTTPVCVANGSALTQPSVQTTWSDEVTSPGFTIGSLAGDPSHSLFGSSPSYDAGLPSDAALASSTSAGTGSGPFSFQYGLQPGLCSGTNFTGL
jgi:hypothetical protein